MSEPTGFSQALALFAPIHKDGYKFVAIGAAVTIAALMLWAPLGLLCLACTVAVALFFRDPVRVVPSRDGLVIAPADGTIIGTGLAIPPIELGLGRDPLTRVSIFLSLLDVHVSRAPVSGRIGVSYHKPGIYLNAASSEAPSQNECHGFVIETKDALRLGIVLVAGTVARRIVTSAAEGDAVAAGERIGIIRFGSRTDIYLPSSPALLVAEGQRTIAGETVIADLDRAGEGRIFRRI